MRGALIQKNIEKLIKTSIGNVVKKSGLEIDIKGEENIPKEGPFMMIANHEGDFDAVALLYAVKERRFGTIAKKELASVPFLNKWMKLITILITAGNESGSFFVLK